MYTESVRRFNTFDGIIVWQEKVSSKASVLIKCNCLRICRKNMKVKSSNIIRRWIIVRIGYVRNQVIQQKRCYAILAKLFYDTCNWKYSSVRLWSTYNKSFSVDLPKFGQHLPSDKMYPNLWFDFLPLRLPRNDGQILSGANISESSFGRFPFSLISATINPIIWER